MILIRRGGLISGASLTFVLWSYLPLYVLPIAIGGCLLKVPIEVRDRHQCSCRSGELMAIEMRCSRKERLLRTLSSVNNTSYTKSRSHIGSSHTSGERQSHRSSELPIPLGLIPRFTSISYPTMIIPQIHSTAWSHNLTMYLPRGTSPCQHTTTLIRVSATGFKFCDNPSGNETRQRD